MGETAEKTQHRVTLVRSGQQFQAPAGQVLLRSAQAAGVMLLSSCRNGTCRACLCRLVEGRVSYAIEWPGLSAEEKAEGWTLPCVAQPESDLVIDERRP